MLVADFASHDLEFLRDDYAHRRLGFSDSEVTAWFKAAGLRFLGVEAIEPPKSSRGKLTVKLWIGARPATMGAQARAVKSNRSDIESV